MDHNDAIRLFESQQIRTAWDEEKEEWYFSIVDLIGVLTDQPTARSASNYWAKMKERLVVGKVHAAVQAVEGTEARKSPG